MFRPIFWTMILVLDFLFIGCSPSRVLPEYPRFKKATPVIPFEQKLKPTDSKRIYVKKLLIERNELRNRVNFYEDQIDNYHLIYFEE